MEHLKNLIEGARRVLVLGVESEYVRPQNDGFARDVDALRGDGDRVSKDLNRTVKRHDKQVHYCKA